MGGNHIDKPGGTERVYQFTSRIAYVFAENLSEITFHRLKGKKSAHQEYGYTEAMGTWMILFLPLFYFFLVLGWVETVGGGSIPFFQYHGAILLAFGGILLSAQSIIPEYMVVNYFHRGALIGTVHSGVLIFLAGGLVQLLQLSRGIYMQTAFQELGPFPTDGEIDGWVSTLLELVIEVHSPYIIFTVLLAVLYFYPEKSKKEIWDFGEGLMVLIGISNSDLLRGRQLEPLD